MSHSYNVFFVGYTIGIIEKSTTLRLSKLTLNIAFSIIVMTIKVAFLPISTLAGIFALAVQGLMVILSIFGDLLKEKEDRKNFKRFYDYKESQTKFRNLIVSGLRFLRAF